MRNLLKIESMVRLGILAMVALLGPATDALAAGPGLTGRVLGVDEDGKLLGTVAGARIELKGGGTTTSDGAGRYKIDLGPGTYPYKLTAAGYKDEDSGRGVQLQLSEGYAVFNFTLTKGKTNPDRQPEVKPEVKAGRLKGQVYEKTPKGVLGIGGAMIALRRDGAKDLVRVVTRGADGKGEGAGRYDVGLEEGEWRASVTARGYQQLVDPKVIRVPGGGEATRDFVLRREEATADQGIMGTVRVEQGEGTPLPISGIEVQILRVQSDQAAVESGSPDGKGQFRKPLAVGLYRVVAEAKGYKPAQSRPTHVFEGRYSRVNLTLVREGRKPPTVPVGLDVVVLDAAAKKPVRSAEVLVRLGGQPLADAVRGQTGADGEVELKISGDGDYSVMARAEGYAPGGKKFSIASGKPSRVEILLQRKGVGEPPVIEQPPTVTPLQPPRAGPATLTVQIVERGGGPIVGADVAVMRGRVRVTAGPTDKGGYWRASLSPGSYKVKAFLEGYSSGGAEVEMGSRDGNVRIYLARIREPESQAEKPPVELMLAIQVIERGGGPIHGAQVVLMGGKSQATSGQTDKGGWWRARVLGHTTYQVKASRQGFSAGGAVVSVVARDATQQITLIRLRQPETQTLIIPGFELPKKPPTRKSPGSGQITPQNITPMVITPLQPQTIKRIQKDDKIEQGQQQTGPK